MRIAFCLLLLLIAGCRQPEPVEVDPVLVGDLPTGAKITADLGNGWILFEVRMPPDIYRVAPGTRVFMGCKIKTSRGYTLITFTEVSRE